MIVDGARLALFLASGLLLNVTPGPDMLFVLAAGSSGGRGCGARAALGIGAGSLVHTVAATLGLSALLASSARAFALVKYAGAAYLFYIGVRALLDRRRLEGVEATSDDRIFVRAVITNVLNPKVALFYLAFVPQFVDAARGGVSAQFLFLGATFTATGTLVNLAVGVAAERLGRALRTHRRAMQRVTGTIFIALGLRLALDRR